MENGLITYWNGGGWRQNIDGVNALLTPPLYEVSYVHMDLDGRENI